MKKIPLKSIDRVLAEIAAFTAELQFIYDQYHKPSPSEEDYRRRIVRAVNNLKKWDPSEQSILELQAIFREWGFCEKCEQNPCECSPP